MHTLISISFSPVYALPLMVLMALAGRYLMGRVRCFLSETTCRWSPSHPAVLCGIWLYSLTTTLFLLSSAPFFCRLSAVLMMSFMLQMAVTDAISGYLPATFTRRFLVAGILMSLPTDTLPHRVAETLTAGILLLIVHALVNRKRQFVGTGDFWLLAGLTAWTGLNDVFWSLLVGCGGFVFWHSTWHIRGRKEGPLGPWLCLGSLLMLLNNLYQPLWVI
ncbi:prepilin peptidase [Salmonella enterica]|nr:prepilin peptidase [Salmonella enterica]